MSLYCSDKGGNEHAKAAAEKCLDATYAVRA